MANPGQLHEVMDRASMMVNIWDSEVASLDATQKHPNLKEAAKEAADALMKFYQLAGQVYFQATEGDR